jgi:hypothetical protein
VQENAQFSQQARNQPRRDYLPACSLIASSPCSLPAFVAKQTKGPNHQSEDDCGQYKNAARWPLATQGDRQHSPRMRLVRAHTIRRFV